MNKAKTVIKKQEWKKCRGDSVEIKRQIYFRSGNSERLGHVMPNAEYFTVTQPSECSVLVQQARNAYWFLRESCSLRISSFCFTFFFVFRMNCAALPSEQHRKCECTRVVTTRAVASCQQTLSQQEVLHTLALCVERMRGALVQIICRPASTRPT